MRLSKTSAQAALAAAYLHQQASTAPVQARQVGEHLGIGTDSALKILQALTRAGVLASRLGRGGGYRLAQPGDRTTLLHIVEAIDGPVTGHVPLPTSSGHLKASTQMLRHVCDLAAKRLCHELARTTVADLAARRARRRRAAAPPAGSPQSPDDTATPLLASAAV